MASPPAATIGFLSWVHQGLAARSAIGLTVKDGHLSLPVRLRLNGVALADVPVQFYGPGDVLGIDAREIVRTEPQNLTADFEPNYFPFIEFRHPDFPWRFTPGTADAAGRLQPWLCLIAVRKDSATLTATPNQPLPVLECPRQELPDLGEAWAWAHAQVARGAALRDIGDALAHPERTLSRVICPRRLDSMTAYYACLVPTFEVGRKAGLGESFTADDEKALRPAWPITSSDGAVQDRPRLPVYHHLEFTTGQAGDFKALADRLQVRPLPDAVGIKEIDVSMPGWGLGPFPPAAAGAVVEFEGALRKPKVRAKPWADDVRVPFQTTLRQILDASVQPRSPGGSTPVVEPPLYGQRYSQLESLPPASNPPFWFGEVNLDPRYRIAAGMGALVVRYQQEELMAAAWDQLAAQQADNERRKRAQLAEAVGQTLADKHLAPLSAQDLVQITAPLRAAVSARTAAQPAPAAALRANAAPAAAAPYSSLDSSPGGPAASAAFRRITRARGPIARRLTALGERGAATGAEKPAARNRAAISAALFAPPPIHAAIAASASVKAAVASAAVAATRLDAMKRHLLQRLSSPAATATMTTARAAVQQETTTTQATDLVRFAPTFTQPMYEPLRDFFADMLLPGLENMPANSIAPFVTNREFVEAYMLGLNHEMSRELVWRGYPTDRRGTYFRRFWDVRGRVPPPTPQELGQLADITSVAAWNGNSHLGEHSPDGPSKEQVVLVIRGDLINRYPRAVIYALQAQWSSSAVDAGRVPGTIELYPMFRASRMPDIVMLGFALTEQQIRGTDTPVAGQPDGSAGWFFVLQEQPTEPRFGLDVATDKTFGAAPAQWSDLSWGHLAANADALKQIVYISVKGTPQSPPPALKNPPPGSATWGKNSAHMASIVRQSPFRLIIHARTWLSA